MSGPLSRHRARRPRSAGWCAALLFSGACAHRTLPPVLQEGRVVLTGLPTVARVRVDDRPVGRGELESGLLLRPGLHRVEVRADGYHPFLEEVRVESSQQLSLGVDLVPIPEGERGLD